MMVVVGGNVLHHVKREGKCPGRGNMSEGEMSYTPASLFTPSLLLDLFSRSTNRLSQRK